MVLDVKITEDVVLQNDEKSPADSCQESEEKASAREKTSTVIDKDDKDAVMREDLKALFHRFGTVKWSRHGTYLATVLRQGAVVWGGATIFKCLMRYPHPQRFVLNIFDVRTGKVMRKFEGSDDDIVIGGQSGVSWPMACYAVQNVIDFSWSPTDPIIALFVPELGGGNQPAKDCLLKSSVLGDLYSKKYAQYLNIVMFSGNCCKFQNAKGRKNSSVSFDQSKASPYPCSSRSSLQYLPKPLLEDVKEWDQKKPSAMCAWNIHIPLFSVYVPPRRRASVHSCVTQHSNYVDQLHNLFVENLSIVPLQSRRNYSSGIAQETRRETRRSNLLDARRVEDAWSVPISSPTCAM
ncbi:hypothetical protein IFM89_008329 [Coptis chinensis]|uniref:Uncharacterized protein n=1 Tax=Coptis chinensis TaxID=261450 RepID=A0A835IBU5_9MAGN|nr:hypothetical protein IFM89_008329 [Coptis chinensis]